MLQKKINRCYSFQNGVVTLMKTGINAKPYFDELENTQENIGGILWWKTGSYSSKRTAFIKFAAATKKGSFIAYDRTNDGSWNHCGFVTAVKSSATINYLGSKYKDFNDWPQYARLFYYVNLTIGFSSFFVELLFCGSEVAILIWWI